MSSNSNDKPELSNPKSYVSNHGIVEVQYGVENSRVDWKKDLFDYVRDELGKEEMFDPDFCTKDKETGERYWFACIVCPCNLYKARVYRFTNVFPVFSFGMIFGPLSLILPFDKKFLAEHVKFFEVA